MLSRTVAHADAREDLGTRPFRRNYQNLAIGVIDHALRDATGTRALSPGARNAARRFIYSTEAEFWADAAGVSIRRIRKAYQTRSEQSDCDE